MKAILLTGLAAWLLTGAAYAQNFTGSITYKMEMKNLPKGVDQAMIDRMVPSKMVIYTKGQQIVTTTNAGPFQRIIMPANSDTAYMVMDGQQRIFTMTKKEVGETTKTANVKKPVVKKTKSTAVIASYPCTQYDVTTEASGQTITQHIWTTDKIKMAKPKVNAQSMISTEVPGTMMRMSMKQMGMDLLVEATDISNAAPPDSVFTLPKGYLKKSFDAKSIQDAMMGK